VPTTVETVILSDWLAPMLDDWAEQPTDVWEFHVAETHIVSPTLAVRVGLKYAKFVPNRVIECVLVSGRLNASDSDKTGESYVKAEDLDQTCEPTVTAILKAEPLPGGTVHSTVVKVIHVLVAQTVLEMVIVGVAADWAKLKPVSETVAPEVVIELAA
jgi:hypothetical protein